MKPEERGDLATHCPNNKGLIVKEQCFNQIPVQIETIFDMFTEA